MDILKELANTPPGTLALLIVLLLVVIFRAYALAAIRAHDRTGEQADEQAAQLERLHAEKEKLLRENGALSAEIYRLKLALNDCLNGGEL